MNKSNIKKDKIDLNSISQILISFYPVFVILGSAVNTSAIILIDLLFLSELFFKKKFNYLKNYFFYLLIFLWLILLLNLVTSIDIYNSFFRSIGFLRYIIFVFAINYFIFDQDKNILNRLLKFWSVLFLIVIFDLLFEFINGKNILGFESYMHGRLSGFFNQELKIGYWYSSFFLIILSYFIYSLKKVKLFLSCKYYTIII